MKNFLLLFFYLFIFKIQAQTEIENLRITSENICKIEKESLFCKAFDYYVANAYDSCYIISSKALIKEKNKEKRDILNYFQGYSATHKNLLKKGLLNVKEISDSGGYSSIKKVQLGYIYLQNKEYEKAINNYLTLISEKNKLNENQLKNVYHNLGISYLHQKKIGKAKQFLDKEFELINKADTASVIRLKTELANIYYHQYLDEKAISLFYEAYDLASVFSELKLKQISTKNIAVVENNRGNYKESVHYYREFIKWKDSIWNKDRIWELAELDKKNVIQNKQQELFVQNQKLKQQELIILSLIAIFGLVLVIGYLIYHNRKKRLLFKSEVQKLKVVQEERKRISEELHDGVLGKLFGIRLNLEFLNLNTEKDKVSKNKKFLQELHEVEKEIRNVSHDLGTNIPEISNFNATIEELMKSKSIQGGFKYQLNILPKINWEQFETKVVLNAYRILQEILHNIVKHAKADNVNLLIERDQNNLIFNIKDDGVGFNINSKSSEGIGVNNVVSRTNKINGKIKIDSEINSGTVIELKIPY